MAVELIGRDEELASIKGFLDSIEAGPAALVLSGEPGIAKVVFVGYQTGLRGPGVVVVPYPNHENHMRVRFRLPG